MTNRYQSNGSTLWMGDIDENMNENFIKTSFNLMNLNPTHVKIVRNKMTGQPNGYGFVSFENEEVAQKVLRELNGKQMPNAIQGKKFRLNITSSKEEEYSIYVGDLSPEVNDNMLFNAFFRHFPSIISAKVMVSDGQSRRFGFVRFNDEMEYRRALSECDKSQIVGSAPISVKAAKPRRPQRYHYSGQYKSSHQNFETPVPSEGFVPQIQQQSEPVCEPVYGSEMNPYYTGSLATVSGHPVFVYPMMPFSALQPVNAYEPNAYVYGQQAYGQPVYYPSCDNMTYSLVPGPVYVDHGHNQFVDGDKLNDDMIAKNDDLYSSIENTRWSSTPIDSDKESKVQ